MRVKAIQLVLCVLLLAGAACTGRQPSPWPEQPAVEPTARAVSSPALPGPSPAVQTATSAPTSTAIPATTSPALPFGSIEIVRLPRGKIEQIACSPDGRTVAVRTSLDVQLYDTQALRSVGHLAKVPLGIGFLPDGSLLVAAQGTAGTQIWDAASGALKQTVAGGYVAGSVAFSPDGQFLALGEQQAVTLWDLSTNKARHTWPVHSQVSSVIFSSDGNLLAATSQYGPMDIWDTSTGELYASLENTGSELPMAFAPDGQSVAAAMGEVRVSDAATGKLLATLSDWPHVARSVAFARSGSLLASGGNGNVRVWDLAGGQPVAELEHPGLVNVLAFCGDGELLVTGGGGEMRLWDVTSQELWGVALGFDGSNLPWEPDWVRAIALSPHGELLASAHDDGRVYLWDLDTGDLTVTLDHGAAVESLSFLPDGTHLASGGSDGNVRLWDIANGVLSATLQHGALVRSIAFSPDGHWLAAGGDDGTVKMWVASEPNLARTLLHGGPVHSIAFSPDGRLLASACADGFVRLWDLISGSLSGSLQPGSSAEVVVFSRDGQWLAVARQDGAVGLWDVATWTLQASFRDFQFDSTRSLAFYPDDAHLLVLNSDQLDLWDTVTGELVYSSIHTRLNGSLASSSDDTLLALGGRSGTTLLKGSETGRPASPLPSAAEGGATAPDRERQPAEPGEMVLIPAGEFQMGCANTGEVPSSCAKGDALRTIYLDAYAIDKQEVTNAQYAACVEDGICVAPDALSSTLQTSFGDPAYADHPVVHVTWFDAQAYCTWAGKRLPTEAEWVKAARGAADARIYPWGNEPPDCSRTTFAPNESGKMEDCSPGTSPVGSHPAGASPYGVMDMCGSVGEWVSDWHQPGYHRTSPDRNPPGPATGSEKILFGSYMTLTSERVRIDHPFTSVPGLPNSTKGFRCASSMAPGIPDAAAPTPQAGAGTQGNRASDSPAISADGRYVAFESAASNLVPDDTNGEWDVFLHDRQTGETQRVSVASDGTQANRSSGSASISADGQYVVFASRATNLVPGDTNGHKDIYLHDRQTGRTTRLSVSRDGGQANADSSWPSISADGRFVAFCSAASNLIQNDYNNADDIHVHDRRSGATWHISGTSNGGGASPACQVSVPPVISAGGRYVVYHTLASHTAAGERDDSLGLFVHDLLTRQTDRASGLTEMVSWDGPDGSVISADGRYVAFASRVDDLVPGDTNYAADVFLHDRQIGNTRRLSVASGGAQANSSSWSASISADGRFVVFASEASNLVPDDTNGAVDIFLYDRQTDETIRVSVASDGSQANWSSYGPVSLSVDARYIAFWSAASNLVPGDTNDVNDIFVHDRQTGETWRVSVASGEQGP